MKKLGLILAGAFAGLLFTYGSIAAMVNQGVSLPAAVVLFFAVVGGGIAIVRLLGNQPPDSGDDRGPQ